MKIFKLCHSRMLLSGIQLKWIPAFAGMTVGVFIICLSLSGCGGMALGKGGLYVDKNTCVGMDDLGVAKVKSGF